MSVVVNEITKDELEQLIEDAVWKALARVLQDPDYGLELREEVIERLQAGESVREEELIPAGEVAKEPGVRYAIG